VASDAYIPPKTASKLLGGHPEGTRHKAAMELAIPLIGDGMPSEVVFATLRSQFAADVTDKELRDVIAWAVNKRPEPSKRGDRNPSPRREAVRREYGTRPMEEEQKPEKTPLEHADWWLTGARLTESKMVAKSPVKLPDGNVDRARLALGLLYQENEHLNIVCKYLLDAKDSKKANPYGGGKTQTREQWIEWFVTQGVPASDAGAWFRINPCAPKGSGKDGAVTDADVVAWRYMLVESDSLPMDAQLALYSRLRLPVAAVVSSAGKSVHAWIKLDSPSLEVYKKTAKRVVELLKPFGIDQANTNCSRLSRLPGAKRIIGASNGGLQELLWLNPNTQLLAEDDLMKFERSLKFPAIEEKPLLALARLSLDRYDYMLNNIGKLGVPTGIPEFDDISGGLKDGQTIVVAGETGGGKSTFGLHLACVALDAGYGVGLFSLEMDKEEIFDLMVSRKTDVSRNKFNTGKFSNEDIEQIKCHMPSIVSLPLYIDDSALLTVEDISNRVMQLKADGRIRLVIVDYIQFVAPGQSRDSREQQVAQVSHGLRALSREAKVPMVILSQLNEEGKLRESRVIAHNANIVMLVEMGEAESSMTVKVVKGRGVPKGEYKLRFDAQFCRLVAESKINNQDVPQQRDD
jgi:KaiC/GvpD/RAD55 family RecA-like ATPase